MSAQGQSRPKWAVRVTSAFAPIANKLRTQLVVRSVPDSEVPDFVTLLLSTRESCLGADVTSLRLGVRYDDKTDQRARSIAEITTQSKIDRYPTNTDGFARGMIRWSPAVQTFRRC